MLGHEPARRAAEAEPAEVAQLLGHGRDPVRHVVVPGTAEVRQASGDGEPARVVERDPHRVGRHLDRAREAAVEVERTHVVGADTGGRERARDRGVQTDGAPEIRACGRDPHLVRVGSRPHEDRAVIDARFVRDCE